MQVEPARSTTAKSSSEANKQTVGPSDEDGDTAPTTTTDEDPKISKQDAESTTAELDAFFASLT